MGTALYSEAPLVRNPFFERAGHLVLQASLDEGKHRSAFDRRLVDKRKMQCPSFISSNFRGESLAYLCDR